MDYSEPSHISIDEARLEADEMKKTVGNIGEKDDYDRSHLELVRTQTREYLQGMDWLHLMSFSVNETDTSQELRRQEATTEYEITTARDELIRKMVDRGHSLTEIQLLEDTERIMNSGGNTLSTKLYGDSFLLDLYDLKKAMKIDY